MPNKDSFTFSDKLKKSKSLPLSKRIPSRVGGDGKAKRTLIQRAQRDLPFIIVAAAALLLLPLLSRNSGVEYPDGSADRYENWVGDGSTEWIGSGDGEIVPSTGYRNPLEYIITPKSGEDSAIHENVDIGDDSSNLDDANKSYVEEMPVRDTYKKAVKPAIRNAVQRKATAIGAFRNRSMSFGGAGSGLTRNLAIGGAPTTNGKAASVRAGVRPVALQPLKSAGAGRVLTGEGLYAEAARSLGALNQGPAKQALFEAQLRDVDGSPLGAAGDPRKAAARLASQGAVPDHKFHYTNQKPWWWDMMQDRSQKLWELWNYNWQKALSDSLIKISTNLAMCLLTGSEDGSVKNFLGIKGGSKDVCCLVDGMELCAGDIGDYTSSSTGSGDSKETTNNSFSSIQAFCKEHNAKTYISESGRKNALQARLECLGLKAGKLSGLSGTRYQGSCDSVNQTPLVYKASATRKADGKRRAGKEEKIVVYVKAKPRDEKVKTGTPNNEFVIALENTTEYTLSEDKLEEISKNCIVTRVGSFAAKHGDSNKSNLEILSQMWEEKIKKAEPKKDATAQERAEANAEVKRLKDSDEYKNLQNALEKGSQGQDVNITGYLRSMVDVQYNYCKNGVSLANFVDESDIQKIMGIKGESGNVCEVFRPNAKIENLLAGGMNCENPQGSSPVINRLEETEFSVTVKNKDEKAKLYAVFVETVQAARDPDGLGSATKIQEVIEEKDMDKKKTEDGVTYTVLMRAGKAKNSTDQATTPSVPGQGKLYWILTNKESLDIVGGFDIPCKGLNVSLDQIIGSTAGRKAAYCYYRWDCSGEECGKGKQQETEFEGDLCAVEDGSSYKLYESLTIPQNKMTGSTEDIYIRKKTEEAAPADKSAFLKRLGIVENEECDASIRQAVQDSKIKICTPICKKKLELMKQAADGNADGEPLALIDAIQSLPGFSEVLDSRELCPLCNPSEDEIAKACNFAAKVNFNTASFNPLDDKNGFDRMKVQLGNCIHTITGTALQNLYMSGFTDVSGDNDARKCPDGNCNQALSEDRAIYSAQKLISELQDSGFFSEDIYNVKLEPTFTEAKGFNNTTPDIIDDNKRLKNKADKPFFGHGDTKIIINAKGCGSEGGSEKNSGVNDGDRVIYFTTTDNACDRSVYAALTAGR